MSDAPISAAQTAYADARAAVDAYVAGVEAEHRERYPNPVGPDGEPRWSEEQALLRSAAWTVEENAELDRLRAAANTALAALLEERAAAAG